MRLALRFVIPLLLALSAMAYAVLPLAERAMQRWAVHDLDKRVQLVARSISDDVLHSAQRGSPARMVKLFTAMIQDERLYALGFCSSPRAQPVATRTYPHALACDRLAPYEGDEGALLRSRLGPLHVAVVPIGAERPQHARLVLVHDMSFVQRRGDAMREYIFYFFVVIGLVVSLVTVIIAEVSWRGWFAGVRRLLHDELPVNGATEAAREIVPELRPLERDLRVLIDELQNEYRPRDHEQVNWTPDTLRNILRQSLHGEEILVASNRQPYLHVHEGERIVTQRPASGLVTALEPVMRACSGTWVAHGNGSADRAVVDARDCVRVPPGRPSYRVRRVWLSAEEESGYYYGFANEGLWPLCHIAHVRPTFRSEDWEVYRDVNQRFADALIDESRAEDPIVLVQDYHLALVPRMIRRRLPQATVITFWHIPWPNPESFAICPWQADLLDGLLGSSILGFHTRFHCNNFLESVDRTLEARIDREMSTVSYRGEVTAIKRYPISIEWPPHAADEAPPPVDCQTAVREELGLEREHRLAVGVDRLDYTKGILERLQSVERLLELFPEWVGRFSFVQIGAPSRSRIAEYRDFEQRLVALAEGINARFAGRGNAPVILKLRHHEPPEVYRYYRAADIGVVTSLHDGMNLVAKEFVASRCDEQGVLILSRFTGAARELPEALVVNPYDIDQCARALHAALAMPAAEQRHRMHLMRSVVKEFNVYRWAGRMLLDAASMRQRGRIRTLPEVAGEAS